MFWERLISLAKNATIKVRGNSRRKSTHDRVVASRAGLHRKVARCPVDTCPARTGAGAETVRYYDSFRNYFGNYWYIEFTRCLWEFDCSVSCLSR